MECRILEEEVLEAVGLVEEPVVEGYGQISGWCQESGSCLMMSHGQD